MSRVALEVVAWTRATPLRRARGALADLEAFAFPQRCPSCGAEAVAERLLCDACRSSIPAPGVALCVRCLVLDSDPSGCRRHPGFGAAAAWLYDARAALAVRALKYEGRHRLAPALGEAIAAALPASYRPDLVIEAPLHAARLRERGYDQSALLADAVAVRLRCPRVPGALVRVRATRPQARLGPTARRRNLSGAFRARTPDALAGREVLVVDDVLTTGATLEACLETLREAGARARAAVLAWAQ